MRKYTHYGTAYPSNPDYPKLSLSARRIWRQMKISNERKIIHHLHIFSLKKKNLIFIMRIQNEKEIRKMRDSLYQLWKSFSFILLPPYKLKNRFDKSHKYTHSPSNKTRRYKKPKKIFLCFLLLLLSTKIKKIVILLCVKREIRREKYKIYISNSIKRAFHFPIYVDIVVATEPQHQPHTWTKDIRK